MICLNARTRCFLFVALLVVAPPGLYAQATDPASSEITHVLLAQQAAWNRGNIRAFMDGYWHSPEVTFSGSSGVTRGWEAVLDRYQQRYTGKKAMGQLNFSDLEIRSLGPACAMVLGTWHLTRASGDVGGVFTLVFEHFPAGWKIIHDHTSQMPLQQP